MKLTHLAILNIRHNFRRYAMYLFAMVFCIFTTHAFLTLMSSESVHEALSCSISYRNTFKVLSLVIIAFTLFFLISSNNSFIRARKKEISTYALFGMTNGRIGLLMLLEVMLLGTIALVIGILLSVFFSKLMVMVLLKLSLSNISGNVVFAFEPVAIVQTLIIYYVIFTLMGLTGFRVISRFQLVDLFKGDQVSENRGRGSIVLLVISLVMILAGYMVSFFGSASLVSGYMLPIVGTVVVGTYLFFWSGLSKLLNMHKHYGKYKSDGERLVSAALLSHRSRTISTMMATIAVLVAISASGIAVGFTLFRNAAEQTYDALGFDLTYYSEDAALNDEVNTVLKSHDAVITDQITFQHYEATPEIFNVPQSREYFVGQSPRVKACSESQYNAIIALTKTANPSVEVAEGEVYLIDAHFGYHYLGDEKSSWNEAMLRLDEQDFKVGGFARHGYHFNAIIVTVFDDSDFERLTASGAVINPSAAMACSAYVGINYNDALKNDAVARDVQEVLENRTSDYDLAFNHYTADMGVYGLICFVGFFICAVFILMTASTMYFKQITAATEERPQFEMLRKIGIDSDTEKRIINKKLIPLFLYPLGLGFLHSIFAMKSANEMVFDNLISAANTYLVVLKYSLIMYAVFAMVYGIGFLITRRQYYQITRK